MIAISGVDTWGMASAMAASSTVVEVVNHCYSMRCIACVRCGIGVICRGVGPVSLEEELGA